LKLAVRSALHACILATVQRNLTRSGPAIVAALIVEPGVVAVVRQNSFTNAHRQQARQDG
jgi:hypothetical protein